MKPSNKIEDKFFGKRVVKEIFAKVKFAAVDQIDSLMATAYRALKNGDKKLAKQVVDKAEQLLKSDPSVPNYIAEELKSLKKSLTFSRAGAKAQFEVNSIHEKIKSEYQNLKKLPKKELFEIYVKTLGRINNADIKETNNAFMASDIIRYRYPKKLVDEVFKMSRAGAKEKFEWTKELGSQIQIYKKNLATTLNSIDSKEKAGDWNNCASNAKMASSLCSQLSTFYATAAKDSANSKKDSPYFSRAGAKNKFSAHVDTDSIKRWVNEYGGNINSDKNRGAWAFIEVNTGETIRTPMTLLFKEAVSWLKKNGKPNSTYRVAL